MFQQLVYSKHGTSRHYYLKSQCSCNTQLLQIDAFKLWMMWKARGDIGFHQLAEHTMKITLFCLESVAKKPGFKLVSNKLQCPNVCFWYIPEFMRDKEKDERWWDLMHKASFSSKYSLFTIVLFYITYIAIKHTARLIVSD